MKTFIFSYLASVLSIFLIFYPSFQMAPFEVVPRILIYFGFPCAVVLSIMMMTLNHFLGIRGRGTSLSSGSSQAGEGPALNPPAKAA